jgi:D-ornithine 4,5-aminomutase subunit beta
MAAENICLSTVPPSAAPIPALSFDLPYAVALRELFGEYKMRAQMNTKYIESDTREATVSHTLNLLISRLTSVDIQSTITPDEGRNVPWHYNNVSAVNTAKQALLAMDGLLDLVEIKRDGILGERVRELKERAILFMEEILAAGGYFDAVEAGFFVDSGHYPERNGDGIARRRDAGVGADSIVKRERDYFAPVCHHFGYNNVPDDRNKLCEEAGGCTMCFPEKAGYIDELDESDNVNMRLAAARAANPQGLIRPEVEWAGDGIVSVQLFLPAEPRTAHFAALEMARQMGLSDAEVIHRQTMQVAEGTYLEVKGRFTGGVDPKELRIPKEEEVLGTEDIKRMVLEHPVKVVAATVGEDEHSVGLREIMDIKHGGLEAFGIESHYLGTSVPIEKVIDAAIELDARAILISTIITHSDIHRVNMRKLHDLCVEKGVRDKLILIGGGTQVTHEIAVECGMDAGFGRGTKGIHVASFMLKNRRERGLK